MTINTGVACEPSLGATFSDDEHLDNEQDISRKFVLSNSTLNARLDPEITMAIQSDTSPESGQLGITVPTPSSVAIAPTSNPDLAAINANEPRLQVSLTLESVLAELSTATAAPFSLPRDPVDASNIQKVVVPVAGVMSGLAVLISGIILCFLLRRRRRIREIHSQETVASPMMFYRTLASLETGGRNPGRTAMEDDGMRDNTPHPDTKVNRRLSQLAGTEETVPSMRHVTEIREEVARLKQLLVDSQQLASSNNHSPNQTDQLSELREEVQRLRHLFSLQPINRRGLFDGASRTTSLPAYEN